MIHSLGIQNVCSFHTPTFIEFNVGAKAGDRQVFLKSEATGESVNSVTGVFGPNASGKTNLLKSIGFLRYFILNSVELKPDEKIPVEGFAFVDAEEDEPIVFELVFEYESKIHRYELEIADGIVQFEALYRKEQRFRFLFERRWNEALKEYHFKSQDIGPSKQITLRENASFLSSAVLQKHEYAMALAEYFKTYYVNVYFRGRMSNHDPEILNVIRATNFYTENFKTLLDAEEHLKNADMGISGISIEEHKQINPEDGKKIEISFPFAHHKIDGKYYKWPLMSESRGTQAFYVLLRYILPVLETGGVAVIDEFETGLHSHLVKYVVELFYSKETNPNGAQLIANFHTDHLLESTLEKYQIVLTEKDPDTLSTEAWRLDRVKGMARNANNHYAKYHAGAYGGIPNI